MFLSTQQLTFPLMHRCELPVLELRPSESEPSTGLPVAKTRMPAGLQRRIAMIDRSDLVRKANDLRQQAELEANEQTRDTLKRLADHYSHLAESQAQSEANPVDVTSLGELFTKGN